MPRAFCGGKLVTFVVGLTYRKLCKGQIQSYRHGIQLLRPNQFLYTQTCTVQILGRYYVIVVSLTSIFQREHITLLANIHIDLAPLFFRNSTLIFQKTAKTGFGLSIIALNIMPSHSHDNTKQRKNNLMLLYPYLSLSPYILHLPQINSGNKSSLSEDALIKANFCPNRNLS